MSDLEIEAALATLSWAEAVGMDGAVGRRP